MADEEQYQWRPSAKSGVKPEAFSMEIRNSDQDMDFLTKYG
jgi:hypothetical protein